ncbi:MAG: MBL fold metallo-hydrolase, partial [Candidatus Methanofastidiosia archaeon]
VLHTPGHTEGSLSLYDLQEEILFSGDTLFHMGIGRMDFPSGSEIDMKNSLQRLNELEIEKIYPGHGQLTTKESLEMVLRFYF